MVEAHHDIPGAHDHAHGEAGHDCAVHHPPPPPPPHHLHRPSLRPPLVMGGIALAGCTYVSLVDPNTSSAYPFCPFRAATGLDCPGCGITRSVRAMLGGDLARAADHNILWVLLTPLFVYLWVVWVASALGVRLPRPSGLADRPWVIWAAAAVLLAFWGARVALGPDAWLASGA